MSDRPTPEQIIAEFLPAGTFPIVALDAIRQHGYVIVHPDDVRKRKPTLHDDALNHWMDGWNDCRRHIFGDSDE